MKVLLLSRTETDLRTGGIAEVIYQMSQELPQIGVEIVVYAGSDTLRSEPFDALKNGTPCYTGPIPKPGLFSRFTETHKLAHIIQVIQKHEIQLIQTCGIYRAGHVALRLKQKLGIPYILTSHGDISCQFSQRNKKTKTIKRYQSILKDADWVTYTTQAMADAAHAILDTTHKCTIIPNGINLTEWTS